MHETEIVELSKQLHKCRLSILKFYSEYAKSIGLTMSSIRVMKEIYDEGNCTQKSIAHQTYLPKQTVNAIIKSFQEQEYIVPLIESKDDKRNKIIELTNKGRKYIENVLNQLNYFELEALKKMGKEKRDIFYSIVNEYAQNLYKIKEENI